MSEITFCLAGGDPPVGEQAYYNAKSIRRVYPDAPVIVGVPEGEDQGEPLPFVDNVLTVPMPIEEYPYSIKPAILSEVSSNLTTDIVCLVDSDFLFLDRITLPESGDLHLLPEFLDLEGFFWTRADKSVWKDVYQQLNIPFPDYKVQTAIDRNEMWPYYQSGIVITSRTDLGDRWLDAVSELFGDIPHQYFTGQVALSALATQYETTELTEDQNYPLPLRFFPPASTEALHYVDNVYLYNAFNRWDVLNDIGATELLPSGWSEYPQLLSYIVRVCPHQFVLSYYVQQIETINREKDST